MVGDADLPQQDAEAILTLLGEVQDQADDLHPATGEGEGVGSKFVVGVYSRARSLFHGIHVLLQERLPEEAAFLLRALLEASVEMAYCAENADDVDEVALRFISESIGQERGLAETQREVFQNPDVDAWVERLQRERHELETLAQEVGVQLGRRTNMLNAAKQLGPEVEGLVAFVNSYTSNFVHLTRQALGGRAIEDPDGNVTLTGAGDPWLVAWVGAVACDLFSSLLVSVAGVLEWDHLDEVREFRLEVLSRLQALKERES